jgi:riboflavin kinase / FMN adenylyltransferase
MKVYYSTDSMPVFRRAVITIGTFYGVHRGHQQILEQLKQEAGRIDGETVIITFHPHPRKVIANDKPAIHLINTIEEKMELLEKNGIDHLVVVPFTKEFSLLTPEEYIEQFLVQKFQPHTIIIGYDHRFGQGRKGDYKLLEQYCTRMNFQLKEIPAHIINENTVSSTLIREAILGCETATANKLLGYDFFFEGTVVGGNKLGRTLGYPTANLQIENEEKLIPGNGIYAVEAILRDKPQVLKGMMSIGIRPTIGGTNRVIEVNLFDFDKDIYGQTLRVYVKHYMRPEVKFNGLDELKEQLAKDKIHAMELLG